jgi:hypothetical protein
MFQMQIAFHFTVCRAYAGVQGPKKTPKFVHALVWGLTCEKLGLHSFNCEWELGVVDILRVSLII